MEFSLPAMLFAGLTIAIYLIANIFYVKYRKTLLNPVMTGTFTIVFILLLLNVPYETYMTGGSWIAQLLGPAVVALAIPLYKQRDLMKANLFPIAAGISLGVLVGMVSGALLTKLLAFSDELILTILPKSLTTPIAVQVATSLGGIPSLAAVFVMIAGFSGITFGPSFLKWLGIDSSIGRGIGLGTSAHGLGITKAMEYGPEDASFSSLAMTISAVTGSVIAPIVVWMLYL